LTHSPPSRKQDAETVAEKIQALSKNQIMTGTYHANVRDDEKHRIHEGWREGRVHVVCATIGQSDSLSVFVIVFVFVFVFGEGFV
jgi:RecG-like helicase